MNKILSLVLFLTVVIFASNSHAKNSSVIADSCEFVSLIVIEGGQSGIDKLVDMFSWNKSVVDTVGNSVGLFREYEFVDGTVHVVADFSDLFRQIFIVLATKDRGNLYVHLNFAHYFGQLRLSNVNVMSDYDDIIKDLGGFSQEPKLVDC